MLYREDASLYFQSIVLQGGLCKFLPRLLDDLLREISNSTLNYILSEQENQSEALFFLSSSLRNPQRELALLLKD